MLNLKGIRNIVFDLGGVIINLNEDLLTHRFRDILKGEKEIDYSVPGHKQLLHQFETGETSLDNFFKYFQQIDTSLSQKEIIDGWNTILLDIPEDRISLLKELGGEFNIFLLSNTNQLHYKNVLELVEKEYQINFSSLFRKEYLSHELGMVKPDSEIFEFVLEDAHLLPAETLFIDDTEEHVLSAQRLGITTHHLDLKQKHTITQLFNEYQR